MNKELEKCHAHVRREAIRRPEYISAWEELLISLRIGRYDDADEADETIRELRLAICSPVRSTAEEQPFRRAIPEPPSFTYTAESVWGSRGRRWIAANTEDTAMAPKKRPKPGKATKKSGRSDGNNRRPAMSAAKKGDMKAIRHLDKVVESS